MKMGEDYAKLAGLTAEEDLKETTLQSMKKRMPWLIILLFLGMIVSSVVGIFENVVAALPIVICFQSLVLDMAGNVGTQSLAVTIRVLMDENLSGKQKLLLVVKEVRIGDNQKIQGCIDKIAVIDTDGFSDFSCNGIGMCMFQDDFQTFKEGKDIVKRKYGNEPRR